MRRPVCAKCRRPLPRTERQVRLPLYTEHNRPVALRMHLACAGALQGAIALALRQDTTKTQQAMERSRRERRSGWTAEEIKALRGRLGLRQEDLAHELGVSRQTVYTHERPGSRPWEAMAASLDALDEEAVRQTGMTAQDWRRSADASAAD